MDVKKILARQPEQGEPVQATSKGGPLKKQRKPESVSVSDFENEGGAVEEDDDWVMTEEYVNPEDVEKMKALLALDVKDGFSLQETEVLSLRNPLSARFHELLGEIGELHDRKQRDYGTPDDPFANVRGATEFGLPAPMGAFIAMSDIMSRIKSFCINGRLENEPLDNALRDMAVYSLIALVLHEEEENGKNQE